MRTAPILVPRLVTPEACKPYQDRNQYHPWVDRSQKHLVEKEFGNPSVTIASWGMVSLGKMLVGEATRKNIQGAVPMSLGHNHT